MREETHERGEGDDVAACRNLTAVHIHTICNGLKCIETDTHRKHKPQRDPVELNAEHPEKGRELFAEKVVILERKQDAKIHHYV